MIATGAIVVPVNVFGQDPPSQCPAPPANGTPFNPGQDIRQVVRRQSASSLSSSQIKQLRQAFQKLKSLPSTDNRAWILQADVHALYCQACNNNSTQIHGTWSFFPWHRAFVYYYERILGSLVGDLNGFRLPYWDWENVRTLPNSYRSPGSSSNSLWNPNRNSSLAAGASLPSTDGTNSRIGLLESLTSFSDFGGGSTWGGACESDPHNPIHMDVGLPQSPWLDMGNLGYAARDPIFFAHHCRIDKLWSNWNNLAAAGQTAGAYENPSDPTFTSLRWSFYDENGKAVSISATDVLDHQNNLRYSYPASTVAPGSTAALTRPRMSAPSLMAVSFRPSGTSDQTSADVTLPAISTAPMPVKIVALSALESKISIDQPGRQQALQLQSQGASFGILFRGIVVPDDVLPGVYDIVSVRGENRIVVGSITKLATSMPMGQTPNTVLLNVTAALSDLIDETLPAKLVIVSRNGNPSFGLKTQPAELRGVRRR